jgi:hypothetical protein
MNPLTLPTQDLDVHNQSFLSNESGLCAWHQKASYAHAQKLVMHVVLRQKDGEGRSLHGPQGARHTLLEKASGCLMMDAAIRAWSTS